VQNVLLISRLLALFLLLPQPARADTFTISSCTERDLDLALSTAHDGDTIKFECSGMIRITTIKTFSLSITLDAAGQSVILDGHNSVAVFNIKAGAAVTIIHLTVINGRADSGGGGITNRGTLTLTDSVIAQNWHGVVNFGSLLVRNTVFSDNHGVGIYNSRQLTVFSSTFTGNTHGIDNGSGTALVVNSTFAGNRILYPGGMGAGIANSGPLTVVNSTFADNVATGGGGGIGTHKGGTVTLRNTIIANNSPTNCFGPMIDDTANLQFPGASCGQSIPSADPLLLPLRDSDGSTPTMALQPGSPAIGAGSPNVCINDPVRNVDQRGLERTNRSDGVCDIGAFEFGVSSGVIMNVRCKR
jgi:hypothetical protein